METKNNSWTSIPIALRDFFAAKAMQGLSSAHDSDGVWTGESSTTIAEESYKIADAMLKEREKWKNMNFQL